MIKELFEKAIEFKKLDDKIQKASNDYFDIIASWSHSPIIENTNLWAFLQCLKIYNKDLFDELERFFYDKPKYEAEIKINNKKFTINNEDDFLNYLIEIYNFKREYNQNCW